MTRYDLRIAGFVLAAVVAIGLLLGYGVGWLTRPDPLRGGIAPVGPAEFETTVANGARTLDGGRLPDYDNIYVNDYAGLLQPSAEKRIRDDLIGLYRNTGIEMTVLTIDRTSDYGHRGSIESFATRLFNTWGIGNALRNDGVLILVARDDREMRIELGRGYGRERDADMKRVIDTVFLPAFRLNDYQDGIEAGVAATIFEVAGAYPDEFGAGTLHRGWSRIRRWLTLAGEWAYALVAVPLGAAFFAIRGYLRRRPRPCRQCRSLMIRAGETADDEHLDGGQRLEEFLKSVDYDVWHCPNCAGMEITRHPAWFSRHSGCPRCGYKTMTTKSTVLEPATTSSTGRKRVDYNCRNCDYANSETRTIPMISESSSSGSSGSSFGGGSSSGGGASGSW
ncbi:MAG: TPM domain-containing protein [Rhodobacter sp.]|nr:TPM domain-containing protein [Rhodobacter sp.]